MKYWNHKGILYLFLSEHNYIYLKWGSYYTTLNYSGPVVTFYLVFIFNYY